MIWDDAKIEQLKELVDQGLSATVIGREMGTTRNSIIGKAYRLRLRNPNGQAPQIKRPRPESRIWVRRDRIIEDDAPSLVPEKTCACTLMQLRSHNCRWPYETLYCGRDIWKNSYCEEHYKKAYRI